MTYCPTKRAYTFSKALYHEGEVYLGSDEVIRVIALCGHPDLARSLQASIDAMLHGQPRK